MISISHWGMFEEPKAKSHKGIDVGFSDRLKVARNALNDYAELIKDVRYQRLNFGKLD